MVNFVIKVRDFDKVPDLLKDKVPEFFQSEEFKRLTPDLAAMPGILCGAFREYLINLHQAINQRRANDTIRTALEKCYSAIEMLSSSADPEVRNLAVVDIFEHLSWNPIVEKQIKVRLGPKSRALYEKWIEGKAGG